VIATVVLAGVVAVVPAQADEGRPPEQTLREIEDEARRIVQYREALHATRDRFADRAPEGATSDRQIIVARRDGWHVLFVRNPEEAAGRKVRSSMVAEVVYDPRHRAVSTFRYLETPRTLPQIPHLYLRALEVAVSASMASEEATPPFDEALFLDDEESFTIYLMSRSEEAGMVNFGGDLLVHVRRSAHQVTRIDALHQQTIPVVIPSSPDGEPTAHTHLHGDLPTVTDVALVMMNPRIAPHLVITPRHMFRIQADGHIDYLGSTGPPAGGGAS
jgi:hypothetical protein